MILRASPSGSFAMLHSLSQIIVLFVSGSVGDHFKPGMLGFPVAANAAQDAAIFLASASASGCFQSLARTSWCCRSRTEARQCATLQPRHPESTSAR
jgi:hypothetical protein